MLDSENDENYEICYKGANRISNSSLEKYHKFIYITAVWEIKRHKVTNLFYYSINLNSTWEIHTMVKDWLKLDTDSCKTMQIKLSLNPIPSSSQMEDFKIENRICNGSYYSITDYINLSEQSGLMIYYFSKNAPCCNYNGNNQISFICPPKKLVKLLEIGLEVTIKNKSKKINVKPEKIYLDLFDEANHSKSSGRLSFI